MPPVRTLEITSVPMGMRPPLAPTSGRGEELQSYGRGLESLGQGIVEAARIISQANRRANDAMQRATATEDANKLEIEAGVSLARIRDGHVKAGTEELYEQDAAEALSNIQQKHSDSHAGKPYANPAFYSLEAEQRLQPLRLGIVKVTKELTVSKNLRVLNQSVDSFVGLGSAGSGIADIEYEFTRLQARMGAMTADGVIDKASAAEIQNQAIVEVMGARGRYLREALGASAEGLVAEESKQLHKYLQPVYDRKAAAARRLGEKEWRGEQERQVIEQVRAFNIPWEEARRLAVESGLDTGKIEGAYSEHWNRLYTEDARKTGADEKHFSKASRTVRSEFILTAVRDKSFDLLKAVEKNVRNLTPEDNEALVDYHRALTKTRKEPDVSDSGVLFQLIKGIDTNPESLLLDKSLVYGREQGLLTRSDFEQWTTRLWERRRELQNKDTERRKTIYNEEQSSLKSRLKVISETQDIDPVAQMVTNEWEERLRGAMWGPPLFAGDMEKFQADPRGFANEMKLQGRIDLENKLATEAVRLVESFPQFIDETTGSIRPGIGALAYKEKQISLVDAKRLELLESLLRRGIKRDGFPEWTFKPTPKPEVIKPPAQTWGQKFLEFFSSEGSPEEPRKAKKEKAF